MSSIPPPSSSAMAAPQRTTERSQEASSYPLFRRRTLGRAASPPTWAWYEQIPDPGEGSCSDDDDEDEDNEDDGDEHDDDGDSDGFDMDFEGVPPPPPAVVIDAMEVDECARSAKGKERAIEPPAPPPVPMPAPVPTPAPTTTESPECGRKSRRNTAAARRTHPRERESVYRPILTIHRSQGFVWNQDLFVPAYIKDRYVTSTSPPGESFVSLTASSANGVPANPYDAVEVVEIRVTGHELDELFP